MSVSVPDQVSFELKCVPDTLLGFCYIPSPGSPHFSFVSLGRIQEEKRKEKKRKKIVIGVFCWLILTLVVVLVCVSCLLALV